jgi:hypothetical protein
MFVHCSASAREAVLYLAAAGMTTWRVDVLWQLDALLAEMSRVQR